MIPTTEEHLRWQAAFHEVGHAIVAHALGVSVTEMRLAERPTSSEVWDGSVDVDSSRLPEIDQITICMAGRIGAELRDYQYSSKQCLGLADDWDKATDLAMRLLYDPATDRDVSDEAIEELLKGGDQRAKAIILAYEPLFDRLAEELFASGKLTAASIKGILSVPLSSEGPDARE